MARQLFLAPCVNEHAQRHFRDTVLDGVDTQLHQDHVPENMEDTVSIWGTGEGNASTGEAMQPGDIAFFYTANETYSHAAVVRKVERNEELADRIWDPYPNEDDPDEWPFVMYLHDPLEIDLDSPALHRILDYGMNHVMGFMRVSDDRLRNLRDEYGSVQEYLDYLRERKADASGFAWTDMTVETEDDEVSSDLDDDSVSREEALEAVEQEVSRRSTSTTTYPRSKKIRRYALQRADGICEGCGDPAPFENRQGKPYLEVHHVYELSDEGLDHPDAVVALCPTCHKRVHHADDGNEYNEELIEKLETELAE